MPGDDDVYSTGDFSEGTGLMAKQISDRFQPFDTSGGDSDGSPASSLSQSPVSASGGPAAPAPPPPPSPAVLTVSWDRSSDPAFSFDDIRVYQPIPGLEGRDIEVLVWFGETSTFGDDSCRSAGTGVVTHSPGRGGGAQPCLCLSLGSRVTFPRGGGDEFLRASLVLNDCSTQGGERITLYSGTADLGDEPSARSDFSFPLDCCFSGEALPHRREQPPQTTADEPVSREGEIGGGVGGATAATTPSTSDIPPPPQRAVRTADDVPRPSSATSAEGPVGPDAADGPQPSSTAEPTQASPGIPADAPLPGGGGSAGKGAEGKSGDGGDSTGAPPSVGEGAAEKAAPSTTPAAPPAESVKQIPHPYLAMRRKSGDKPAAAATPAPPAATPSPEGKMTLQLSWSTPSFTDPLTLEVKKLAWAGVQPLRTTEGGDALEGIRLVFRVWFGDVEDLGEPQASVEAVPGGGFTVEPNGGDMPLVSEIEQNLRVEVHTVPAGGSPTLLAWVEMDLENQAAACKSIDMTLSDPAILSQVIKNYRDDRPGSNEAPDPEEAGDGDSKVLTPVTQSSSVPNTPPTRLHGGGSAESTELVTSWKKSGRKIKFTLHRLTGVPMHCGKRLECKIWFGGFGSFSSEEPRDGGRGRVSPKGKVDLNQDVEFPLEKDEVLKVEVHICGTDAKITMLYKSMMDLEPLPATSPDYIIPLLEAGTFEEAIEAYEKEKRSNQANHMADTDDEDARPEENNHTVKQGSPPAATPESAQASSVGPANPVGSGGAAVPPSSAASTPPDANLAHLVDEGIQHTQASPVNPLGSEGADPASVLPSFAVAASAVTPADPGAEDHSSPPSTPESTQAPPAVPADPPVPGGGGDVEKKGSGATQPPTSGGSADPGAEDHTPLPSTPESIQASSAGPANPASSDFVVEQPGGDAQNPGLPQEGPAAGQAESVALPVGGAVPRPLVGVHVNIASVEGLLVENHDSVWVILEVLEGASEPFLLQTPPTPVKNGKASFSQEEKQCEVDARRLRSLRGSVTVRSESKGVIAYCTVDVGSGDSFRTIPLLRRRGSGAGQGHNQAASEGSITLKFECPVQHRPLAGKPTVKSIYLNVISASGLASGDFTNVCEPFVAVFSTEPQSGDAFPGMAVSSVPHYPHDHSLGEDPCDDPDASPASETPLLPKGLELRGVARQGSPAVHLMTSVLNGFRPTWGARVLVHRCEEVVGGGGDAQQNRRKEGQKKCFTAVVFDRVGQNDVFIGFCEFDIPLQEPQAELSLEIPLKARSGYPEDGDLLQQHGSLGHLRISTEIRVSPALGVTVTPTEWNLPNPEGIQVKYAIGGVSQPPLFTSAYQPQYISSTGADATPDETPPSDAYFLGFPTFDPLDFSSVYGAESTLHVSLWSVEKEKKIASGRAPIGLAQSGTTRMHLYRPEQGDPDASQPSTPSTSASATGLPHQEGSVDIRFKWESPVGISGEDPSVLPLRAPWGQLRADDFVQDKSSWTYTMPPDVSGFIGCAIAPPGVGSAERICLVNRPPGLQVTLPQEEYGADFLRLAPGDHVVVENSEMEGRVQACFLRESDAARVRFSSQSFVKIALAKIADRVSRVFFTLTDTGSGRQLGVSRVVNVNEPLLEWFSIPPVQNTVKIQAFSSKERTFLGEVTVSLGRRAEWLALKPRYGEADTGLGAILVSSYICNASLSDESPSTPDDEDDGFLLDYQEFREFCADLALGENLRDITEPDFALLCRRFNGRASLGGSESQPDSHRSGLTKSGLRNLLGGDEFPSHEDLSRLIEVRRAVKAAMLKSGCVNLEKPKGTAVATQLTIESESVFHRLREMWHEKTGGILEEMLENYASPAEEPDGKLTVLAEVAQRLQRTAGEAYPDRNRVDLFTMLLYTMAGPDIDAAMGYANVPSYNAEDTSIWEKYKSDYSQERNPAMFGAINWAMRVACGPECKNSNSAWRDVNKWIKTICLLTAMCHKADVPSGKPLSRGLAGLAQDVSKVYASVKAGETIDWGAASSCATDVSVAEAYVKGEAANAKKESGGTVLFTITEVQHGLPLESISKYPKEAEVLLPPLSSFRVSSREEKKALPGVVCVEMRHSKCFEDDAGLAEELDVFLKECLDESQAAVPRLQEASETIGNISRALAEVVRRATAHYDAVFFKALRRMRRRSTGTRRPSSSAVNPLGSGASAAIVAAVLPSSAKSTPADRNLTTQRPSISSVNPLGSGGAGAAFVAAVPPSSATSTPADPDLAGIVRLGIGRAAAAATAWTPPSATLVVPGAAEELFCTLCDADLRQRQNAPLCVRVLVAGARAMPGGSEPPLSEWASLTPPVSPEGLCYINCEILGVSPGGMIRVVFCSMPPDSTHPAGSKAVCFASTRPISANHFLKDLARKKAFPLYSNEGVETGQITLQGTARGRFAPFPDLHHHAAVGGSEVRMPGMPPFRLQAADPKKPISLRDYTVEVVRCYGILGPRGSIPSPVVTVSLLPGGVAGGAWEGRRPPSSFSSASKPSATPAPTSLPQVRACGNPLFYETLHFREVASTPDIPPAVLVQVSSDGILCGECLVPLRKEEGVEEEAGFGAPPFVSVDAPLVPAMEAALMRGEPTHSFQLWCGGTKPGAMGGVALRFRSCPSEEAAAAEKLRSRIRDHTSVATDTPAGQAPGRTIHIYLTAAHDLAPLNVGNRTSCPFARFFINGHSVAKTEVVPSSLSPHWGYCLELPYPLFRKEGGGGGGVGVGGGGDAVAAEAVSPSPGEAAPAEGTGLPPYAEVTVQVENESLLTKKGCDGFLGEVKFDIPLEGFGGKAGELRQTFPLKPRGGKPGDLALMNEHGGLGCIELSASILNPGLPQDGPAAGQAGSVALPVGGAGPRPLVAHVNIASAEGLLVENHELVWVKLEVLEGASEPFLFQTPPTPVKNGKASFSQEEKQCKADARRLKSLRGSVTVCSKSKGVIAYCTVDVGSGDSFRTIPLLRRRGSGAGQGHNQAASEGSITLKFECPVQHRPPTCKPTMKNIYLNVISASGLSSGDYSETCMPRVAVFSTEPQSGDAFPGMAVSSVPHYPHDHSQGELSRGDPDASLASETPLLPKGLELRGVARQGSPAVHLTTSVGEGVNPKWGERMLVHRCEEVVGGGGDAQQNRRKEGQKKCFTAVVFDRDVFIGFCEFDIPLQDPHAELSLEIPIKARSGTPEDDRRLRFNNGSLGHLRISTEIRVSPALGLMVAPTAWNLPNPEGIQVKYAIGGVSQPPLFTSAYQPQYIEPPPGGDATLDETPLSDAYFLGFPASDPIDFSSVYGAESTLHVSLWSVGNNKKIASGRAPIGLAQSGTTRMHLYDPQCISTSASTTLGLPLEKEYVKDTGRAASAHPLGSVDIRFKWESPVGIPGEDPSVLPLRAPWGQLRADDFVQADKSYWKYIMPSDVSGFVGCAIAPPGVGGSAERICLVNRPPGLQVTLPQEAYGADFLRLAPGDHVVVENSEMEGRVQACFLRESDAARVGFSSQSFVKIALAKGIADRVSRVFFTLTDTGSGRQLGVSRVVNVNEPLLEWFSIPPVQNTVKIQAFSSKVRTFLGEVTVPLGRRAEWLALNPRSGVEADTALSQINRGLGAILVSSYIRKAGNARGGLSVQSGEGSQENSPSPRNRAAAAARLGSLKDVEEGPSATPRYTVTYINVTNRVHHKTSASSLCPLMPEGASAVRCKGKIYSVGGVYSAGRGYQKQMTAYDVASGVWRYLACKEGGPPLRHGHCAVVHKGKVFVYGGWGPGGFDRNLVGVLGRGGEGEGGGARSQRASSTASPRSASVPGMAQGGRRKGRSHSTAASSPRGGTSQCSTPAQASPYAAGGGRGGRLSTPQHAYSSTPSVVAQMLSSHSVATSKDAGYHMNTWCFDPALGSWVEFQTEGSALDYRAGHAGAVVADKMIVWGGWKVLVEEFIDTAQAPGVTPARVRRYRTIEQRRNDMAYLDLETRRWKKVKQKGNVPSARCSHTMVKHKLDLIVFGGCEANRDSEQDTQSAASASLGGSGQHHDPNPAGVDGGQGDDDEDEDLTRSSSGVSPKGAKRVSAPEYRTDRSIFALNDLYIFDAKVKMWRERETAGGKPAGRYGHSAQLDPSRSSMMVVGGWSNNGQPLYTVFQLDLATFMWRKVSCWDCRPPDTRLGHTCVVIPLASHAEGVGGSAQDDGDGAAAKDAEKQKGDGTHHSAFQLLVSGGVSQPLASPSDRKQGAQYHIRDGEPAGSIIVNFAPPGFHLAQQRGLSQTGSPKKAKKEREASPPKKKQPEEIEKIVERLTSGKTKRSGMEEAAQNMRKAQADEGAARKMTATEMQENAERLYYVPVLRAKSKAQRDHATSEARAAKKKFVEHEQHENIDRVYYQARKNQTENSRRATQRVEDEFQREQLHKGRASFQQQLETADRLYYKTDEERREEREQRRAERAQQNRTAEEAAGRSPNCAAEREATGRAQKPSAVKGAAGRAQKRPAEEGAGRTAFSMSQAGWQTTVSRLYQPRRESKGNVFEETGAAAHLERMGQRSTSPPPENGDAGRRDGSPTPASPLGRRDAQQQQQEKRERQQEQKRRRQRERQQQHSDPQLRPRHEEVKQQQHHQQNRQQKEELQQELRQQQQHMHRQQGLNQRLHDQRDKQREDQRSVREKQEQRDEQRYQLHQREDPPPEGVEQRDTSPPPPPGNGDAHGRGGGPTPGAPPPGGGQEEQQHQKQPPAESQK